MERFGSASAWNYGLSIGLPIILIALPAAIQTQEAKCAYVIMVMALWWILVPIPLGITALLPVVFYPLLGILSTQDATTPYMKESVMMFLGGLIMAVAVEHCNLHKRIALKIVLLLGTSLSRLMLGIMLTTMVLSMWISNTAATAMMVPIVEAINSELTSKNKNSAEVQETEEGIVNEKNKKDSKRLNRGLLLSVAYAANCGGTGTLTGTGPNLVLKGMIEELYPQADEISFGSWMLYSIPGMLLSVIAAYFFLQVVFIGGCCKSKKETDDKIRSIIKARYKELGPITFHQVSVIILFILLLLLWVFLDPKFIPGWSHYITDKVKISDSTPAIGIAILLFILPADRKNIIEGPRLLSWDVVKKNMPWGIFLLIGGGFSMAEGAKQSGLSNWIGSQMTFLESMPAELIVLISCTVATLFTEVVSNVATANIFIPVINEMAKSLKVNPLFLIIPVTVACSFAFMLPAATPPNAIIFGAGKMKTWQLAKPGMVMNFICVMIQYAMINTLGVYMFDLRTFPKWANSTMA